MGLMVFSILRGPPRLTHWEIGQHAIATLVRLGLAFCGLVAILAVIMLAISWMLT